MSTTQATIFALDAAYKPFPTFKEWAAKAFVDPARWDRYKSSIESRAANLSPEVLNRARNIAKRAAALDTGAIEGLYEVDRGFTYTVAFETAAWEAALAQKGENVRSLFEAQLHAYDYVLDLATKAQPISEAAIRALHEEVVRAQSTYRVVTAVGPQEQALPKGQYKALPNHVRTRKGTDHSYAPVDVTPAEMARLVAELRREDFLKAHPVLQAAYAHYGLVVIHPFADGNGRVARALASAFTYRAISMPIVILSEQKDVYLNALERADAGDYQDFVNFILDRSLDTIMLVEESILSARTPSAEQSIAAITKLYTTKGGYTYEEVDQAATRLMEAIIKAVEVRFRTIAQPRISGSFNIARGLPYSAQMPAGYRIPIGGLTSLQVVLSSPQPAQAGVTRTYNLFLPTDPSGADDVRLLSVSDPGFVARMDELIPSMSGILQMRVSMFAERLHDQMLAQLGNQAAAVMGKPLPWRG